MIKKFIVFKIKYFKNMGNSNSNILTHFTLVSVNYNKLKFEKISNCNDEKSCPLDIFFNPNEEIDKIKLLKNNDKPFEIYGLNRVLFSHNYINLLDSNGDSRYISYIQEKINTQKKSFFIISWKQYYKKDFLSREQILYIINKKYSFNTHQFSGKELKTFFTGMGSLASMKINTESKKYTFLPTNILVLKYNKFIIYDQDSDLVYTSSYRTNFEFFKDKDYNVIHFYEIK
jgi:hypothetical protein